MNVADIFNAAALEYDAARPRLIPFFEEFYGTVLELIPFERDAQFSVLDLGAGTGLLSAMIGEAFPQAHLTLSDVAPAMLDIARQRFQGDTRFNFRVEDYLAAPFAGPLAGRFDIVVSGLSIHHTPHERMPSLLKSIHKIIRSGGLFINADQALGITPEHEAKIEAVWQQGCRDRGTSEAELAGAIARMKADLTSPLEQQLAWMREAGFSQVECWLRHWRFVVYSGRVA